MERRLSPLGWSPLHLGSWSVGAPATSRRRLGRPSLGTARRWLGPGRRSLAVAFKPKWEKRGASPAFLFALLLADCLDLYVNCIYNKHVAISYDPAKNDRNIRERGLSFERATDFDFTTAVFLTEIRDDELWRVAVGYLDKRLHLLCYVPRVDGIRVISFRKTNKREAKLYGKAQTIN
jgi:uncharacterized DUF497 family protein